MLLKASAGAQPFGFCQFDGGAFGFASESIGCGELGANHRMCRSILRAFSAR